MLQQPADDGADPNVVRQLGHLGGQDAGAADNHLHPDPGLRGLRQGAAQGFVGQRIHLEHDPHVLAFGRRGTRRIQAFDHGLVQVERRHQHLVQARQPVLAGQMQEDLIEIGCQRLIGGQVAQVGIQARRPRVVVAGRQVRVALELPVFSPGDQQHLGVCLQTHHTIDHLGTDRLQTLGIADVGFFIKPCLELHHRGDLLAPPDGFAKQLHELRLGAGAVDGLLDGQHIRVLDRFPQESQHRIEALVRLVDQDVALLQPLEKRLPRCQLDGPAGTVTLEPQAGHVHLIDQLVEPHQVDGPRHPVERFGW